MRIESQFKIWVEDNEIEEKDRGQVDNLEDDIPLQYTFRQQNQEEFVPPSESFIGGHLRLQLRYLVYHVLSYPQCLDQASFFNGESETISKWIHF